MSVNETSFTDEQDTSKSNHLEMEKKKYQHLSKPSLIERLIHAENKIAELVVLDEQSNDNRSAVIHMAVELQYLRQAVSKLKALEETVANLRSVNSELSGKVNDFEKLNLRRNSTSANNLSRSFSHIQNVSSPLSNIDKKENLENNKIDTSILLKEQIARNDNLNVKNEVVLFVFIFVFVFVFVFISVYFMIYLNKFFRKIDTD